MKKIYLLIILVFSFTSLFAQTQVFSLSNEKPVFPNQYVAIEVDSLSIESGYNRVLEWVNVTYNNPNEVIKSQLENKYVRIEGIVSNFYPYDILNTMFASLKYKIEFKFKQNKVKFEVIETEYYVSASQYTSGGWVGLELLNEKMFKKNGKPKKSYAKKANKVMGYFNDLVMSLDSYLNKPIEETENDKDDW